LARKITAPYLIKRGSENAVVCAQTQHTHKFEDDVKFFFTDVLQLLFSVAVSFVYLAFTPHYVFKLSIRSC